MKNLLRQYLEEGREGEGEDIGIPERSKRADAERPDSPDPQVQQLTDLVYETDPAGKALTGRTPERIQQETGIPKEQMFPENAKILYVGDPWQRMGKAIDNSNLTIIDYEFGDVTSFVTDNEGFRSRIAWKADYLLTQIGRFKQVDSPQPNQLTWLNEFKNLVQDAKTLSDSATILDDYPKAADAWRKAKEFIEEQYKKDLDSIDETKTGDPGDSLGEYDAFSALRKEAWYACIYGERGFRDIPDFYNIIVPKIDEKKNQLLKEGAGEEEAQSKIAKSMRGWIEEIRLKKIPEKANVVEGVFPALPFKARSFDRFVASWSISAHTFGELDKAGFLYYWSEIYRVLDAQGEAYIFPLHYSDIDEEGLEHSLKEFAGQHSFQWKYFDWQGQETPALRLAETLWLKKI